MKDRAGFIVNALLFPYLNNAVRMLGAGHGVDGGHRHRDAGRLQLPASDRSALLDLVGLDTSVAILDALYAEFQRPQLRGRAQPAPHGRGRAARPQDVAGLLRLLTRAEMIRAAMPAATSDPGGNDDPMGT